MSSYVNSDGNLVAEYNLLWIYGLQEGREVRVFCEDSDLNVYLYPIDQYVEKGEEFVFVVPSSGSTMELSVHNVPSEVIIEYVEEAPEPEVIDMYSMPSIVPAAVSSELDDGGEERIHIAPYVEPPPPPPPPPPVLEPICVGESEGGMVLVVLPEEFRDESEIIVYTSSGDQCGYYMYNRWMGDGVHEPMYWDDPYCGGENLWFGEGDVVTLATPSGDKMMEVEVASTSSVSISLWPDASRLTLYTWDIYLGEVFLVEVHYGDDVYTAESRNWEGLFWENNNPPPEGIPDKITLHVGDGGLVDMCGRVVTRGEE